MHPRYEYGDRYKHYNAVGCMCGVWFHYTDKRYSTRASAQRAVDKLNEHADEYGEDYKVGQFNIIMRSFRVCSRCSRLRTSMNEMYWAARDIEEFAEHLQDLRNEVFVGIGSERRQYKSWINSAMVCFLRNYEQVKPHVNMEQLLKEQLLLSI